MSAPDLEMGAKLLGDGDELSSPFFACRVQIGFAQSDIEAARLAPAAVAISRARSHLDKARAGHEELARRVAEMEKAEAAAAYRAHVISTGLNSGTEDQRHLVTLYEALTAERERVKALEMMVYVPGRFRCAKCDFFLTSTNLHVANGTMSANNAPHACPNGCGPMWRVSERDERKEAQRSYIELHEKLTASEARATAAEATVREMREALEELVLECQRAGIGLSGQVSLAAHQKAVATLAGAATKAEG